MNRVTTTGDVLLIECINHYIGKYRIRWDVRVEETLDPETNEPQRVVSYYETDCIPVYKLRLEDIKQAILNAINTDTENTIISGFRWKDMPIWLSSENQFNYKAAYDLTIQSSGSTLPVLFKFGTTSEPIYYTFNTIEELSEFYIAAMKHISDTLAQGWEMKDSVDWKVYADALKKI